MPPWLPDRAEGYHIVGLVRLDNRGGGIDDGDQILAGGAAQPRAPTDGGTLSAFDGRHSDLLEQEVAAVQDGVAGEIDVKARERRGARPPVLDDDAAAKQAPVPR